MGSTLTYGAGAILLDQTAVILGLSDAVRHARLGPAVEFLGEEFCAVEPFQGGSFLSQARLSRRLYEAGNMQDSGTAGRSLPLLLNKIPQKTWSRVVGRMAEKGLQGFFSTAEDLFSSSSHTLGKVPSPVRRGTAWQLLEETSPHRQEIGPALKDWRHRLALGNFEAVSTGVISSDNDKRATQDLSDLMDREFRIATGGGQKAMGSALHPGLDPRWPTQQDSVFLYEGALPGGLRAAVAIVADGFREEGKKAGQTAARSFFERLLHLMLVQPSVPIPEMVVCAARHADKTVSHHYPRGGTTFAGFVQIGVEQYLVNVGNTGSLFISETGEMTRVGMDHAAPDGRLLRFLGLPAEKQREGSLLVWHPDVFVKNPRAGGFLVLFSDGVIWRDDFDWPSLLFSKPSSYDAAAHALIQGALACEGLRENMAVGIVRIPAMA